MTKPTLRNQLAFYALLASGTYIILLWSPQVLGRYVGKWRTIAIFIFPWLMLCLAFSWQVLTSRRHRPEIILIVAIIILGILNVCCSDSPVQTLPAMWLFLLGGIIPLWVAMFLFGHRPRLIIFDWFCAGALAVVLAVELGLWVLRGPYGSGVFQIFINHPIPLGTLVILLSPGPVRLLAASRPPLRLAGGLLVLAALFLIFLTHKRGTWLTVAAMLVVVILYLARRRRLLVAAFIIALAVILPLQAHRHLARLNPGEPHDASILQRLELYNFALHVWKAHPFTGMGLRSYTHQRYLPDYHRRNPSLTRFPQAVATIHTFDNMLLTSLVEMGSLLTLAYLGLFFFIVIRYGRRLWAAPVPVPLEWFRLLVLGGFALHSLSYDSLLFPPVNWLFHVHLGIMAAFAAPAPAPPAQPLGKDTP
jgi:O-antigen ligase